MEELEVIVINFSLGDNFFFFSLSFQKLHFVPCIPTEISPLSSLEQRFFKSVSGERVCLVVKSVKVSLPGS